MNGHAKRTHATGRRRVLGRTFLVLAAALACLALDGPGGPGAAAQDRRSYTLDEDPIRQGDKALERADLDEATRLYEEAVAAGYRLERAFFGLAEIAVRRGRYDEAEAGYRRAMAASGDRHPVARGRLGLLLLRQGRETEARQEFTRALAEDGKVWAAHYGLARLHLAAGEWGKAKAELDHGRGRRGVGEGEDAYQHGLALYLLSTGDRAGAERAALLAMHLNPGDAEHGTLVARIHREAGQTDLAIGAYEQALATEGMTPTAPLLHDLGNLYREQQRFNEARDRYLAAVAVDSTYVPVLEDLADLLHRAERWDTAARTYLRYLAAAPADTSAWLGLSSSLYELQRYDQAADAAGKAAQLDPAGQDIRFARARVGIHATADSLRGPAAALMDSLPAELPWRAADWIARASWLTRQQDFAAAQASLERAAALDPATYEVPFQQGIIALRAGQAEAAVGHFGRAVELSPGHAAIHLNLGIALYQAGRPADAAPAFAKAAELDENLVQARLLLGQALAAGGDLAAAETAYGQVLAKEPGNAKALRGIGYCRLRRADYRGAADAYRTAAGAEPGNADAWAGLGSARLGLGELEAAGEAFTRARAIDPKNVMLVRGAELLQQALDARKENESR